ncbi:MAG: hypothetical protein JW760_09655 [Spirochaetales bacterium]|nr:hypothetical protein [Spirochaetales bacterium]
MRIKKILYIYIWFSLFAMTAGIVLPHLVRTRSTLFRIESWEILFDEASYHDIQLRDDWRAADTLAFRNPGRLASPTLWLKTRLPEEIEMNSFLAVGTIFSSAVFFVEDDILGTYGSDDPNSFAGFYRTEYHLPPDYGGKTLYARITSHFPLYIGIRDDFLIGPSRELYRHMILKDLLPLGFTFFYLLSAVLLVLIRVYNSEFTGTYFLAFLCVLVAFYTYRYTDIKNLFPPEPFFWDIIGVAQTFCIPFFFILFIKGLFPRQRSPLITAALGINTLFAFLGVVFPTLLYLTRGREGFLPVFTAGILTRVLLQFFIFATILLLVIYLVRIWKRGQQEALLILAGFVMLGVSSLSSLAGAAGLKVSNFTSHLHVGMFLFMSSLVITRVSQLDTLLATYREQVERYKRQELRDPPFEEYRLSPREIDVVREILVGRRNKDIAEKLFISERTVKAHLYNVFTKCRVKNRLELVYIFSEKSA